MSVQILRPLPRKVTRPLSLLALAAWIATMGVVIDRSYLQASSRNLATDLARYGTQAQWRGVYYRGEKIGFTVSQVQAKDEDSSCRRTAACSSRCSARRRRRS